MTTQDLTNNKTRIIKFLKWQGADLKLSMEKMVKCLDASEKATMKNIDSLSRSCMVFAESNRTINEINEEQSSRLMKAMY